MQLIFLGHGRIVHIKDKQRPRLNEKGQGTKSQKPSKTKIHECLLKDIQGLKLMAEVRTDW